MTARAGYVCGVDLGTTYATFCLLSASATELPSFAIFRTATTELGSSMEGARSLAGHAKSELAEWRPLIRHVRFERPMGRHVRSVANLSRTMGALSDIWDYETSLDEISPGEWKRLVGLRYLAAPGEYRLWAEHKLRPVELVEHEAAAFGVACSIIIDSAKAETG